MKKYFQMLGGPGSGKGTQAKLASQKLNIGHLSTGDKLRELLKNPNLTPAQQQIKQVVDAGGYAPDELMNQVIKEWLSEPAYINGVFLDGYPRTLPQILAFEKMLLELGAEFPAVFLFNVSRESLYIRMTKRVTCATCGVTYNTVTNPPKVEGVCDLDDGDLVSRKDQDEDAVMARFDIYFEKTAPLIDFYKQKNMLYEIDGENSIDKVHAEFMQKISHFVS